MPAGSYWYHPHLHMLVEAQIFAGLAGAIVQEGGLDTLPALRHVPQRWIVIQNTEVKARQGRRRRRIDRNRATAAVRQRRAKTRPRRSAPGNCSAGGSSTPTRTASWCCAWRTASASRCSPRTGTRWREPLQREHAADRARLAPRGARARRQARHLRAEGDPVRAVPRRREGRQRRAGAERNAADAALGRASRSARRSRAQRRSATRSTCAASRSTASARSCSTKWPNRRAPRRSRSTG